MTGELLHRDHSGAVYALAEHDGQVLSAGADGLVLAWEAAAPDHTRAIARIAGPIYGLARGGPDDLALGSAAGTLHLLNLRERREQQALQAHAMGVYALAWLRAGALATAGGDGTLALWERSEPGVPWALRRRVPLSDAKVRGLALSPDGAVLGAATGDGRLHLLDAGTLNAIASWYAHEEGAHALAFHPRKPALVSGGKDGHLRTWDLRNGQRAVLALPAHRSTIYQAAFSPSCATLATASRDKTVKLWQADSLDPLGRLDARTGGHAHSVNALRWTGSDLISAGDDRRVVRWSGADQKG